MLCYISSRGEGGVLLVDVSCQVVEENDSRDIMTIS